jgi:hypothetical protein
MPCEVRAEVEETVVFKSIYSTAAQIKDVAPVVEFKIHFVPRIKQK